MSENQNSTENQQLGNTKNPMVDLLGNDYAAFRKAVADGMADAMRKGYDPRKQSQTFFNDKKNEMQFSKSRRNAYKRSGNIIDDIEEGIKEQLLDSIAGGDFKKGMKSALAEFTKQFGFELKDLPHEYGKHLGKALSDSKVGQAFSKKINSALSNFVESKLGKGAGGAVSSAFSSGAAGKQIATGSLSTAQQAANAKQLFSSMSGAAGVAAVAAVAYILLKPLLGGITDYIKAWGKAWSREEDLRKKRLDNAKKRNEADLEYLAREPFEILKNAVTEWENAWDQNLNKISLTQGYTKEDVYDLYSSTSLRLISEGLTKVIPATDVINKLSNILDSGLSGRIAEEFAYQATKLNAAVPTEDFTGYASTYAQLAAEQIALGKSQDEALAYANQQLETFASNLLYSSRTLTGGFTTGLKNASSLFASSVNIAQAAKSGNASQISGTLTAVSAVIGAVAPDLAEGLVQNVVNAAIGGNSDTLVALRSLSGMNAGNTEFLQALANDPQGLFVRIFSNLASLQTMSPSNYMEVAEGLSSVFGVDMQALARVDFANLAASISEMQVNNASLTENLNLLKSGEATMSSEQIKLQEINNQILEEGLTYVLDSEAGRAIQQHMWEEQIANQLAENEYAVSLQGAALTYLEGLRHAVANILNFLNPIGYLAKGVENMVATTKESESRSREIEQILQKGAIGSNAQAYSNLITKGQDLQLIRPLVELYGAGSHYNASSFRSGLGETISFWGNPILALGTLLATGEAMSRGSDWNRAVDSIGGLYGAGGIASTPGYVTGGNPYYGVGRNGTYSSIYSGFTVGKSALGLATGSANSLDTIVRNVAMASATQNAAADTTRRLQEFYDSAAKAAVNGTFNEYVATARDFGISDLDEALSNSGQTMEDLRNYFEQQQGREGALKEDARKADEQTFRDETRAFWDFNAGTSGVFQTAVWLPFLNDNFKPFFDSGARYDQRMNLVDAALSDVNTKLTSIEDKLGDAAEFTVIGVLTSINSNVQHTFVDTNSSFQKCLADWVRYIAASRSYTNEVSSASSWDELKRAEGDRQNETLLALAQAMNVFSADELKKLDPQMQANALLGKIVIILEAMMQQNNNVGGGLTLPDTLSALGFGVTYKTTQ